MEKYKIQNFYNSKPNLRFPRFRTLSKKECQHIKKEIEIKFKINDDDDFLHNLHEKKKILDGKNTNSQSSVLLKILKILCPKVDGNKILINWDNFTDIDEIAIEDFINFFDDIWYPEVDDIEIFDLSLEWMIIIDHGGYIFFSKIT